MIKNSKYVLLTFVVLLYACGGSGDSKRRYTVTLTDIALSKKGSGEALTVSGLPAHGATLTQH